MKSILLMCVVLILTGCGDGFRTETPAIPLPGAKSDGSVVRAIAVYSVQMNQQNAFHKFLQQLTFVNYAYAATGTTTVTYSNAASVNFTINVASLGAVGFTGNTLNLGSVSLATLSDNHLKVCGAGSNQKCTKAVIRVYTTGSVAGFVQTVDNYGEPVYVGTLNPAVALGLNSAGSVQVQTFTIPANRNKVTISDFASPTYSVTSDFSDAGDGPYSMNFVVEYALLP